MPEEFENLFTTFNFQIEIDGVTTAGFKEVQGLDSITEVIEYREGSNEGGGVPIIRKIAGRTKYSNLILRRGYMNNDDLWQWRKLVVEGADPSEYKKDMSVKLCNAAGEVVMQWDCRGCWPCRWSGPNLDAHREDFSVEEIEIVVEEVDKQ